MKKKTIITMDDKTAIEAGKEIGKRYAGVFKKLAKSEHAEIKCANCIHFSDKVDKKVLKKLPSSERENVRWVCAANDMKTEPHLLRCGGDDFQNKYETK